MKKTPYLINILLTLTSYPAIGVDTLQSGNVTYTCPNQCTVVYDNDGKGYVKDSQGGTVTVTYYAIRK